MKEHPILFSTPMVEAILAGRKTMTRRLMKPQPILHNDAITLPMGLEEYAKEIKKWKKKGYTHIGDKEPLSGYLFRPIKKEVGDQLWVREKWMPNDIPMGWPYHYYAANETFNHPDNEKWKPSLFMPREASRIQLGIIDIRAERIQDITREDAIAEGIKVSSDASGYSWYRNYLWDKKTNSSVTANFKQQPIMSFRSLWISINKQEMWDLNPWVWRIEFKSI